MIVNNPESITLKNLKGFNVKQKIVNNFDNFIFAIVLNGFSDPKESLSDSKRRINQATKV